MENFKAARQGAVAGRGVFLVDQGLAGIRRQAHVIAVGEAHVTIQWLDSHDVERLSEAKINEGRYSVSVAR